MFVSTIEGKSLPIYGVQWHPERPIFEWGADESGINHGPHAIEVYLQSCIICSSREGGGILAEDLPARRCSILQTS